MKKMMIMFVILAASLAGVSFANNTVGTTTNPTGGIGVTNYNHNDTNSTTDSYSSSVDANDAR